VGARPQGAGLPPYPRREAVEAWAWVWDYAEFQFLSAEEARLPAGWNPSTAGAAHSTVVLLAEGDAACRVGERVTTARAGDLVWVPEGLPAGFRVRGREGLAVAVRFAARLAGAQCLLALLGFPPVVRGLGAEGEFREMVRLQRYAPGGWRQRATALLTSLVLRVVQERPEELSPAATVRQLRALRWLCPALRFADQPEARLSVREMARALACSATHLRRVFRESLGTSPGEWLRERRLRRAADLLVATDQSVEQVARAVGYESLSHFHRSFRLRFGCTPAEYRVRVRVL